MAYFPNGSAGMILDDQCDDCFHASIFTGCPICLAQMEFNYDQCSDGQEKLKDCLNMLVGEDGICKMRKLLVKTIHDYNKWVKHVENLTLEELNED